MSFDNLGLSDELLSALITKGYTTPTPIQTKTIPEVFNGSDILAGAQTGTGKTAAFALPILQILSENPFRKKRRRPRALILTPTRELAAQVADNVKAYGRRLALRSTVVYGGVNINPQIERFQRGVDIVVATPGRLLDHCHHYTVDLSYVEFLVLDEADRMLDMGFIHDIRKIMEYIPEERQNLMFSATYSKSIRHLADSILTNPVKIDVAPRNTTAEAVTQQFHPVERNRKRELLTDLIHDGKWNQVLIFTRTKHGANRLTKQLSKSSIQAAAIHSNKSQATRTRTLRDFKKGSIRVLVATDVAARGLDIDSLPYVVNFDLPKVPEDYVHRIGRTGRAGQNGIAVSLVCRDELDSLKKIEQLLKQKITLKKIDGFQLETPETGKTKNVKKKTTGFRKKPGGNKRTPAVKNAKTGNQNRNRPSKNKPAPAKKKRR